MEKKKILKDLTDFDCRPVGVATLCELWLFGTLVGVLLIFVEPTLLLLAVLPFPTVLNSSMLGGGLDGGGLQGGIALGSGDRPLLDA